MDLLRQKADEANHTPMFCSLIVDAMAIKKHICWSSASQRFVGYVNYGNEAEEEELREATEAVVLLVNGIFGNWKQPIAYFFSNGMTGSTLAQLLRNAMEMLHSINIRVIALTFDGDAKNQAAVRNLGLNTREMLGSFPHPSNSDWMVYGFFDPCHMLKLVRNTLKACGKILIAVLVIQVDAKEFMMDCLNDSIMYSVQEVM